MSDSRDAWKAKQDEEREEEEEDADDNVRPFRGGPGPDINI
jgi:hypothetical protein